MPVRLLAFAASLRRDSRNRKLLALAVADARAAGAEVAVRDFHDFVCPNYDFDLQQRDGIAAAALAWNDALASVDGMLIASPEYNYSLPGTLKNAVDWLSRIKPMPLRDKWLLLLAASTSMVGGIRGLWQLRIPFEGVGTFVYPDMFALAQAQKAFTNEGQLADPLLTERLAKTVAGFVKVVGRQP